MKHYFIIFSLIFFVNSFAQKVNVPPSVKPPGGLQSSQVPQFIVIGADDNAFSGDMPNDSNAMRWMINFLKDLKNPSGNGNIKTFDGSFVRMTFYCNTMYFSDAPADNPYLLMKIYNEAYQQGHEFGNHTHSHPHGVDFNVKQWEKEMKDCAAMLAKPLPQQKITENIAGKYGPAILANDIVGFRTPYLEYEDSTLQAAYNLKYAYDCSIEEGYQDNQDGTNFFWPYTLDNGSPGHQILYFDEQKKTAVNSYPGMWELPAYCMIVPPDEKCEQYGVSKGLRRKMSEAMKIFDTITGKVTGFDYNLWTEYSLNKKEVLAILKYTFDLRYNGNRCPFMLGIHTQFYHDSYKTELKATTVRQAQEAIEEFIQYVLSKSDTRIVPAVKLMNWCEAPVPLTNKK